MASELEDLREIRDNLIRAWESLPEGKHDLPKVQEWLDNQIRPVTRQAREQRKKEYPLFKGPVRIGPLLTKEQAETVEAHRIIDQDDIPAALGTGD